MSIKFLLPQGDTFSRGYSNILDEYGTSVSSLSGWSFVSTLKSSFSDTDDDAIITITGTDFKINNSLLTIDVVITPVQLAQLVIGRSYYFSTKAKTPTGFIGTIDEIVLIITQTARKAF